MLVNNMFGLKFGASFFIFCFFKYQMVCMFLLSKHRGEELLLVVIFSVCGGIDQ